MPPSTWVELVRFAVVGLVGLVVDIAVLQGYLAAVGYRPYSGQALAWCVAVTTNWALNRRFTFTGRATAPLLRQWAGYVVVNSGGAAINYATYAVLVAWVPVCAGLPALAATAGAVAGLMLNFVGSRRLVFKS